MQQPFLKVLQNTERLLRISLVLSAWNIVISRTARHRWSHYQHSKMTLSKAVPYRDCHFGARRLDACVCAASKRGCKWHAHRAPAWAALPCELAQQSSFLEFGHPFVLFCCPIGAIWVHLPCSHLGLGGLARRHHPNAYPSLQALSPGITTSRRKWRAATFLNTSLHYQIPTIHIYMTLRSSECSWLKDQGLQKYIRAPLLENPQLLSCVHQQTQISVHTFRTSSFSLAPQCDPTLQELHQNKRPGR